MTSPPTGPSADANPQPAGAGRAERRGFGGWPVYVLLFVGVFLIVLAIAIWAFIAPRVVKAPLTIPQKYTLILASGSNFTYYDAAAAKDIKINVSVTRTVLGDPVAGDNSVAVYDESLCLTRNNGSNPGCVSKQTAPDLLITNSTDRIAFNRVSGMAVNDPKYGGNVDGDTSIRHVGLGYKFPIDTKKTSYPFFDTTVHKAFPMRYVGEQTLQGLTVYRFVQKIVNQPALTNGTFPSTYSNTRTVWIEPTTGVIVDGQEQLKQVLTGRASLDPNSKLVEPSLANVVALQGTLAFTPKTVQLQAQLAKDNLPKIHLIRLWLPLISLIVGIVAIAAAVIIALIRRRRRPSGDGAEPPQPEPEQGPMREPEPASAGTDTAVLGTDQSRSQT